MSTTDHVVRMYIHDVRGRFGETRRLAEKALAQLSPDAFKAGLPGSEGNSAAVLVKHIAGHLTSRWTNFLTEDGDKPDRDREGEFAIWGESREDLMERWDEAWRCLLESLEGLTHADLAATVAIRGEPHSVPAAINRSLAHASYHVGQIVQLARWHRGAEWESLSIPPGGTDEYKRVMAERFPSEPVLELEEDPFENYLADDLLGGNPSD